MRSALTAALALGILSLAVPVTEAGAVPVVTFLGAGGNGYIAPGANGNLYVALWTSDEVLQVTPNGTVTDFASIPNEPWAMTSDAQGNIFVDQYLTGTISEISPTGSVSTYVSNGDLATAYGLAFGPGGNLFVMTYGGDLYQVAPNLTVTFIASGAGGGGLAVNPQGLMYSGNKSSSIMQITPGGVVTTFATIPGTVIYGVAVGPSGTLYAADDSPGGNIYRVSPAGQVTTAVSGAQIGGGDAGILSIAFDASGNMFAFSEDSTDSWRISGVDVAPAPLNLVVTETSGQVTGSWYGPSGVSYTCTLMYGFNDPSSTTAVTTTPSCTFEGLDTSVAYGIEVVATNGYAYGAPAIAFGTAVPAVVTPPPPKKHSIVCKKNHSTAVRAFTRVHPTCPAGWHRIG